MENGKENANYYFIRVMEKENGNCYFIRVTAKKTETTISEEQWKNGSYNFIRVREKKMEATTSQEQLTRKWKLPRYKNHGNKMENDML